MPDGQNSGSQTVKQSSTPWSAQIPYLTEAMGAAQNIWKKGAPSYYPFSTVAPVAPETQSAWSAQTARAVNGSPLVAQAKGYNSDVMSGKYLNAGNPYQGAVDQSIWDATRPRVDSMFAGAGRYGSGSHVGSMTTAYDDSIAPLHFQNYQAERGAQANAAAAAPGLAATDYNDIQALGQVGAQRTAQAQTEIQAAQDRYNYDANAPGNWLAQYIQSVSGNYGGQQKSTQPVQQTPWWQSLLSAGAGAAGLAFGA